MRLSPRVTASISALVDREGIKHPAFILNLGTGGMFLRYRSAMQVQEGDILRIRYKLPLPLMMKHRVRVVRNGKDGCAVSLTDGEDATREAIWNYVSKELAFGPSGVCPFCGAHTGQKVRACPRCLCSLEFERQGYFEYLERMSLFRTLEADVDRLQPRQIQGLVLFGLASFLVETVEAQER